MSDRSGKTPEAAGADLLLPALAVGFTIYFFASVWDLTWEAKANATVVGIGLLALIAILLFRIGIGVARGDMTLSFDKLIEPRWAQGSRFAIVGLTAVFVFALPWLGLTLGLFLLTGLLMLILRAGSWRAIALTSAIVSLSAYLLFIALLNSRMPRGPVEKLLALVFGGG